jgi:catechol 2,3-dioxygenase-like lactoylglutathione lyase family enzyme
MIHHITREIPPSALDACLAFYAMLGFEPVTPPASLGERAAWLRLGGTQLHLLLNADAVPAGGHVAIVAEEYDALVKRLHTAGYEVEPRRPHWGSPRGYVRDPFGNLCELMAFPPDEA